MVKTLIWYRNSAFRKSEFISNTSSQLIYYLLIKLIQSFYFAPSSSLSRYYHFMHFCSPQFYMHDGEYDWRTARGNTGSGGTLRLPTDRSSLERTPPLPLSALLQSWTPTRFATTSSLYLAMALSPSQYPPLTTKDLRVRGSQNCYNKLSTKYPSLHGHISEDHNRLQIFHSHHIPT